MFPPRLKITFKSFKFTKNFKNNLFLYNTSQFDCILVKYFCSEQSMENDKTVEDKVIKEGSATIKTAGKVFYNPVQQFNRDLSVTVISTYAKKLFQERSLKAEDNTLQPLLEAGQKYDYGLYILEALSATGLRSVRYAKEIPGVKEIVANDISYNAVDDIKRNVLDNKVEHLVTPSHNDAVMLMYQHKKDNQFDVIDLDPYGCPSIFLDSTVQSIKDGGLLLVTATDMAVLAGNTPETCYAKYGAVSLRMKSCHEMAVRILLQSIEATANKYSRYIVPLLSLSADFYIRVFVRVYSSAYHCKFSITKLSQVYHCTGCGSFVLNPLGITKPTGRENQVKFGIPTGPPVSHHCEHCKHTHHIGGPIWSAPIHDPEFTNQVLQNVFGTLGTAKRIQGVLSVINEELNDVPLYYTLEKLSGTIHVETPGMMAIRSAILNAGYQVSYTHMNKTGLKTNAPPKVLWDIMRCWQKSHPVSKKRLVENSPATNILSQEPEQEYSFESHENANPDSKKMGFLRFQVNPSPYWGPGSRSTAMVGEQKIQKSKKNQGKRKREESEEVQTI